MQNQTFASQPLPSTLSFALPSLASNTSNTLRAPCRRLHLPPLARPAGAPRGAGAAAAGGHHLRVLRVRLPRVTASPQGVRRAADPGGRETDDGVAVLPQRLGDDAQAGTTQQSVTFLQFPQYFQVFSRNFCKPSVFSPIFFAFSPSVHINLKWKIHKGMQSECCLKKIDPPSLFPASPH